MHDMTKNIMIKIMTAMISNTDRTNNSIHYSNSNSNKNSNNNENNGNSRNNVRNNITSSNDFIKITCVSVADIHWWWRHCSCCWSLARNRHGVLMCPKWREINPWVWSLWLPPGSSLNPWAPSTWHLKKLSADSWYQDTLLAGLIGIRIVIRFTVCDELI